MYVLAEPGDDTIGHVSKANSMKIEYNAEEGHARDTLANEEVSEETCSRTVRNNNDRCLLRHVYCVLTFYFFKFKTHAMCII